MLLSIVQAWITSFATQYPANWKTKREGKIEAMLALNFIGVGNCSLMMQKAFFKPILLILNDKAAAFGESDRLLPKIRIAPKLHQ